MITSVCKYCKENLMNYYNEFDPFAAAWLRELIKEKLIPNGKVDERSIADVRPEDLKGFTQCHLFAGIGGWSRALQIAGWHPDRPVWTGSPPCQPFSLAGKQQGKNDERHLWPVWFNLVRKCRPPIIFGEQVSSAIRHGWLDSLQEDLEAENYACAAAVLPASGIGALHKRDRLWIVAHSISQRSQGRVSGWQDTQWQVERGHAGCGGAIDITMVDSNDIGHQWNEEIGWKAERRPEYAGNTGKLADTRLNVQGIQLRDNGKKEEVSEEKRESEHRTNVFDGRSKSDGRQGVCGSDGVHRGFWNGVQAVQCKDGKVRAIPTEPALFPLAYGIPNRVGILRGAGNAIVPQVAAQIIKVFV